MSQEHRTGTKLYTVLKVTLPSLTTVCIRDFALYNYEHVLKTVASIGLVSRGAATNSVTYFFKKKLTTFFSHRPLQSDYLF